MLNSTSPSFGAKVTIERSLNTNDGVQLFVKKARQNKDLVSLKIYETSGDKIQLLAQGPEGIEVNRCTDIPQGNKFKAAMKLENVYKKEIEQLDILLKLENKKSLYL